MKYEEIASDWGKWIEYMDVDGVMSREEFEALSIEEKVRLQVEAFGPENQNTEQELNKMKAKITSTRIMCDGYLAVNGFYQGKPFQARFSRRNYSGKTWELVVLIRHAKRYDGPIRHFLSHSRGQKRITRALVARGFTVPDFIQVW